MADLNKVAAVLEAVAEYYEENERAKAASNEAVRTAHVNKIAATYVETHGEELPDTVRQKLAAADDASLSVIEDLLSKQAGVVTSLGAGAESDSLAPKTIKEAAADADERFVSWILA